MLRFSQAIFEFRILLQYGSLLGVKFTTDKVGVGAQGFKKIHPVLSVLCQFPDLALCEPKGVNNTHSRERNFDSIFIIHDWTDQKEHMGLCHCLVHVWVPAAR